MSPDLVTLLRRIKPEKRQARLHPRPTEALVAASAFPTGRVSLVPDTNVYIHAAAGTLPAPVAALLDRSLQFHCSVCLAELAMGVAAYSPNARHWPKIRDHYAELFAAIPDGRVLVPDAETWTQAALVAGTLARTQGFDRSSRTACLNDALILLAAAKAGLPVLTASLGDFDMIQQVAGGGMFLHF